MATTTNVHPLEPLSGEEIAAATAAVREQAGLSGRLRFSCVELGEPTKDELESGEPAHADRAELVVLDNADGRGREVTVELDTGTVTAIHVIEGMQPAITGDEYYEAGEAAKARPRVPRGPRAARDPGPRAGDGRLVVDGTVRGSRPAPDPGARLATRRYRG